MSGTGVTLLKLLIGLGLVVGAVVSSVAGIDWGSASSGAVTTIKAPEIDATSGVQAIALLTAGLLLAGEAVRRRVR